MTGCLRWLRGAPAAGLLPALLAPLFAVLIGAFSSGPAAAQGTPPAAPPSETAAPATAPTPATPATTAAPATPATIAEDIRDIRGPKSVPNPWLIPALACAVILAALGAYALWRWQRKRRRPRVLAPFEVALLRLEELRHLMQPASAREFSTAASDIIRVYIEQRFDMTATHRTTEEFLHDLLTSSNASLARHRGLLEAFLNQCDLVKFAGVSLSVADMESLHDSACVFVRETAAPDPPAATATASGKEARDSLPAT